MISYEDALKLKQELESDFFDRHRELERLRQFWDGTGWWKYTEAGGKTLSSIFREATRNQATPDIKLIHNVVQEVCVKYQGFLSPLPMIHVYPDKESELGKAQAELKERALYAFWAMGRMSAIFNEFGWYLPLMGDAFLGIWPDFDRKIPVPIVRSPENAYPVLGYDGRTLEALMFYWKVRESIAARSFPEFVRSADKQRGKFRPLLRRAKEADPNVEILEYSDDQEFARFVDGDRLNGVEHKFGFNLFEQLSFIHVPGQPFNSGAVEQIIGLNESHNFLYSLVMQRALENVFPPLILKNPYKFSENIDRGAGAVIAVNEGGDANYLVAPQSGLDMATLGENERMMKQGAAMPEATFGSFQGGSTHISGKAINEMQGAGTGSTVEMVQGLGIGLPVVAWNEKALFIAQNMFREDSMDLNALVPQSSLDLKGRPWTMRIKGKQLVGSQRNEVIFSPHMDQHEKLVMALQGIGAGIVSREWTRNQIGVPDSERMSEEIMGEKLEDMVLGAVEQELLAQATPENAASAEDKGFAYLQGATPVSNASAAPSLPPPSAPPGAAPQGAPGGQGGPPIETMPGGGQVMARALRMPPGAPLAPQGQGPEQAAPANPDRITLDEAVKAFQSISGLKGRVFLEGEIVQSSETSDDIEVALTDPTDRQAIVDGLPQWSGRLTFHTVSKEPAEPHIEVTQGAVPAQAGQEADLSAIIGAG